MSVHRRHQMAFALLLAALCQPAWEIAHAAIHQHLAQHHAEAAQPERASEPHAHGTRPTASQDRSHDHEHEHLVVTTLPTRGADAPSHVALPSTTPLPVVVATRHDLGPRQSLPLHTSPDASGPSGPRAPPIS